MSLILALAMIPQSSPSDQVRACQVGYLPNETKFAIVTAPASGDALIREAKGGKTVLTAKIGEAKEDADSGDTVRAVDFSALKTPGDYVVDVPGVGTSYPFRIGKDVFARPLRLAMRSFTGQRCGTAVNLGPDFPDYHYPACHTDVAHYHPSSGKSGDRDVSGGWHDAGDFGKYIVNSGITTGTLLWAFEIYEGKLKGLKLDIPESKRRMPDMLSEIKWNLDWMLKMQDTDGGVWHKATSANFPGMIMPDKDNQRTLVIGTGSAPYKNTTATADFAAVCAIAARVYRKYDRAYADQCRMAAEKAWNWLKSTPDHNFTRNPEGINTGGYGDNDPKDERLWAAAELYRTTGQAPYNAYFKENYGKITPLLSAESAQGWGNVGNMAMYTYLLSNRDSADEMALRRIRTDALVAADGIASRIARNGYRMPLRSSEYFWGSNSVVANYSMMLLIAHRIEPKREYRDAALDGLHYLLGRNTFNTSYVTQVGTKWAMHPHHRPSEADGVAQPWPGLLVGGPNAEGKKPPARQWKDEMGSYTTNENAINWNAALVFALAGAQ